MNERRVALAVLVLVVVVSLAPPSGGFAGGVTGTSGLGVDKLLHTFGYAVLTYAILRAIDAESPQSTLAPRQVALVVLVVAAFGAGVELAQSLVGRTTSLLDALANLAGAIAGAAVASVLSRSR